MFRTTNQIMSTPDCAKPWFMKIWGYSPKCHDLILFCGTFPIKQPFGVDINPGLTLPMGAIYLGIIYLIYHSRDYWIP